MSDDRAHAILDALTPEELRRALFYLFAWDDKVFHAAVETATRGRLGLHIEAARSARHDLTAEQRDGVACVICGDTDKPMRPVGFLDGGQVFACTHHGERGAR